MHLPAGGLAHRTTIRPWRSLRLCVRNPLLALEKLMPHTDPIGVNRQNRWTLLPGNATLPSGFSLSIMPIGRLAFPGVYWRILPGHASLLTGFHSPMPIERGLSADFTD